MDNPSKKLSTYRKQCSLLSVIGDIIIRIFAAVLALAFGFWLLLASNMGPAYLPHIMDGALDFWIRMTLLGLGIGIWIMIAVWLIWLILFYLYRLFGPNH